MINTTPAQTVTVDVVDSAAAFAALSEHWNGLLQTTPANSVFLTWEWISTWWQVYGAQGQLHVLVARDGGGRLVGIAPFKRVRRSLMGLWRWDTVTFIGSGADVTPEYLDLIIKPGWESVVVAAFVRSLGSVPEIKVIDLAPFAATSRHLTELMRLLAARPGGTRRKQYSACPVFELPASRELFMASRSKNYRKKIGEFERRCATKLGAEFRRSETLVQLRQDMRTLMTLHRRRWSGRTRAFRSARYVEFHERLSALMLERGWIRLFVLEAPGKPLAALYCFAYGNRYSFYQSGRDPAHEHDRVGLVIMHKAILEAIAERATIFDFLRGREGYKYRWAKTDEYSERLLYWTSLPARGAGFLRSGQRRLFLSAPSQFDV